MGRVWARSSSGPGRRPFKPEIAGSKPARATPNGITLLGSDRGPDAAFVCRDVADQDAADERLGGPGGQRSLTRPGQVLGGQRPDLFRRLAPVVADQRDRLRL